MTTPEPTDPAVPVPPVPEATPEESAAQQAAAEKAAAEAALHEQIRALAAKIAEQAILDFDPATIRKGTVASLQTTGTPPTVTITISGDTTTEIPGVRFYEHYPPQVGDVVHLIKQGTDLAAVGKIAEQFSESSFTTVSLAGGFTHNGNGNGDLKIRRVWDHGAWKVQVQGSVNRSSGTVISSALDPKYRPVSSTRRTVLASRDANGSNVVKIDFNADGTITMVGGATTPGTESAHGHGMENNDHDHGGGVSSEGAHTHGIANNDHNHGSPTGTTSGHSHSIATTTHKHGSAADGEPGGTTSVNAHSHSLNTTTHKHGSATAGEAGGTTGTEAHDHPVDEPVWISFNGGTEYFL